MMAAEDYFDFDPYWERDDDPECVDTFIGRRSSSWINERPLRTCTGCGTAGLEWRQVGHQWRLFDAQGDRHMCAPIMREYADEDDFEDLS
jgi:hypothetical protein